jgi:hypothetical protein
MGSGDAPRTGDLRRLLAEQLVAPAREEAIDLVGPENPLTKVTKSMPESALKAELTGQLSSEP